MPASFWAMVGGGGAGDERQHVGAFRNAGERGRLRARGVHIVDADEGYLACDMTGARRLAGIVAIAQAMRETLGIRHDFEGEGILVAAGPTCEDLNRTRFLTNRSSGRMSYAMADAASRRSARSW